MNRALLIVVSLFLIMLAPELFSEGMFMDGLIYSSVSRNLAEGIGTIWEPSFSQDYGASFYGHPPLMFVLQAFFFNLFGDYFWVERLFPLMVSLLTVVGIHTAWKSLGGTSTNSWFPVLLWIFMNEVVWACANNMLENTMTFFLIWFLVFYLRSRNGQARAILFKCLSGICIVFAFYVKGPVALFPIAFPFVLFINKRLGFRQMLVDSLWLGLIVLFSFLMPYLLSENAAVFWNSYWELQILKGAGASATVESRWFIIGAFFKGIAIPSALCFVVILLAGKWTSFSSVVVKNKWSLSLFFIALCGVVPMMISVKQRGFYILGVYPYMSLCLGLLAEGAVSVLSNRLKQRKSFVLGRTVLSNLLLIIGIAMNLIFWGKPSRDIDKIKDVEVLTQHIDARTSVGIPKTLRSDWSLRGYCQRMGKISLDDKTAEERDWYLSRISDPVPGIDYEFVSIELESYKLYKKIN